jgi:hypothetical protein
MTRTRRLPGVQRNVRRDSARAHDLGRRMWPAELGWAMNGVLRSDRAIHSRLQCGSARPICRLARGVVFARRCGLAEPTIHDGVDHLLSTFGVRRAFLWVSIRFSANRFVRRHQRSRSGPNGQPPESSHLARSRSVMAAALIRVMPDCCKVLLRQNPLDRAGARKGDL